MTLEQVAQDAMQIILHAGEARKHCTDALKDIENSDFDSAKEKMKLANAEIVIAHRVQTNCIQKETEGAKGEYSVLFAHAQDTLMTVYSEINIAKRLIDIFESLNQRLIQLEMANK
ncbi:PTS lactose/cellobiose transporter subunit IIA [Paenibacillus kribbensis]|uniref:PTS lactose/cellobiose transporter subunit IIA n=1 Tax=Paenibacillus kribbensis TaxID=172713 RepID=A0A222WM35_9BACL|nr:PTS lactose/cellobiose transporter subunit IIA [Paenibacillus kribbensis]ASR47560.1 PTS lactose/cellobiose transporter subunit IIA [Paenibacillus kribbensis]MEC0236314.1 PTS lactose/cellobiose transporter subunit IIA [Paenibacillus kribbensis]